jgi:hypothetical protein
MRKQHPSVNLHIDRIVLNGFGPMNKQHIHDVIATRLSELFTRDRVPMSFQKHEFLSKIDAGSFQLNAQANDKAIGIEVANAVYKGLKK